MCGPKAAKIADTYGQPVDASSANALTGKIAVANTFDNGSTPGSIPVCTVSAGCTKNLTNPAMDGVAGVAMDNKGNCWADGINPSVQATLTYFAGCAGRGVQATGFGNAGPGGIDIDASGNLLTIDVREEFGHRVGRSLFGLQTCVHAVELDTLNRPRRLRPSQPSPQQTRGCRFQPWSNRHLPL